MAYVKTVWRNDQTPPINASNLNNIENGIENNDQRLANIEDAMFKVVRKTYPAQDWPAGGKWISAPYVSADTEEGYRPVGVLSSRPQSNSALIAILNVDLNDFTFRGYVRNLSSTTVTGQELWAYVLYQKIL